MVFLKIERHAIANDIFWQETGVTKTYLNVVFLRTERYVDILLLENEINFVGWYVITQCLEIQKKRILGISR